MSGNGIACLAQAVVIAGVAGPDRVAVATDAGLRSVEIVDRDSPRRHRMRVDIGAATIGTADVWLDEDGVHDAATVDVGNPHVVLSVDDPAKFPDRRHRRADLHVHPRRHQRRGRRPGGGWRSDHGRVRARRGSDAGLRDRCLRGGRGRGPVGSGGRAGQGRHAGRLGRRRGRPVDPADDARRPRGDRRISTGRDRARSGRIVPMTLIDRAIREKIVLVGVVFPTTSEEQVEESLDELALLVDTAGADDVARVVQRRNAPDPAYYIGKGKVDELEGAVAGRRLRHGRVRRRAHAGPAVQAGEAARTNGDRPHRGDPRHLRPERIEPRGQGPGRAGDVPLPAAAASGARARPCRSRPAASAPAGVPARPSSRSTAGGSSAGSTSSRTTCATSPVTATPSASAGAVHASSTSPSSATRTRASRRCSTG